ncbi:MAG: N-acetyltransferase [Flavobacteriaceae bacterium]|nr:N-acetyltransferase [Flavobacteriaceae bacterium]
MREWTIKDNEFLRQYEVKIDGHLAKMEYSTQERKIFLTKLVVPTEIEDETFKEEFIRGVLSTIEDKQNVRVVPTSPQIVSFLRRNRRQYQELLPVGIRI